MEVIRAFMEVIRAFMENNSNDYECNEQAN
jgi:hypothetical protein